jgi:hypothetical protein
MTTAYTTINAAVSYYPRADLPGVTIGFAHFRNTNGAQVYGPDSLSAVDDRTERFYLQSSYTFEFLARNTASFHLSTSDRVDHSVRRYNVGNTIVGLGLSSQFGIPLQTGLDVALNLNSLPPGLSAAGTSFNYTTVALRGRYEIEKDILSVSGALTPTFGNFKRTVIDVGSEWLVQQTMSVQLQFTFFSNAGSTNDTFVNLRCRYDV